MVGCLLDVNLIDSHPKNCWTTKYLYFGGRVLFGCPSLGEGASNKLFETKTLVLVFKVDFNPKPRFGVEKLLDDKIFIFWR
jgi:hypothetical protein